MKDGKRQQPRAIGTKRKRSINGPNLVTQRCENHPRSESPPLECGICMEPVKARGMLDSCGHVFCFSCITKWSKRSSSCPHCKREIEVIIKSDVLGKKVISRHVVKRRNLRDTLDREEFQQRRRQLLQRERDRTRPPFVPLQRPAFAEPVQLLSVHQSIRDNMMTRFSSTLRGLQDNLLMYNRIQTPMMPISFDFCGLPIPPLWSELNFGMNSSFAQPPPTLFQSQTFSLPNLSSMPGLHTAFNSPGAPLQYANLITQELASTLASLSHPDPTSMFQREPQNLNYNPGTENDRRQLPYFQ